MKSILRDWFYSIIGRNVSLIADVDIKASWYGNTYGGFFVYPKILSQSSIVYSFGIGEDVSFDLDIIKNHNSQVFGFDPTPKSISWVTTQNLPSNFKFYGYGISSKTGFETFYLPKNNENVSGSLVGLENVNKLSPIQVPLKSLRDICQELKHSSIDVLKIDIEGAEYDVLENVLNSSIEIKQICIEFHHRMFPRGGLKTKEALELLKKHNYLLFKFAESKEEVSFIRRDFL